MAVIDAHLHFFSRTFFETLAGQSPQQGTVEEKLARVKQIAGLELPPPDVGEHLGRWIAELDRHGVEQVAAFASVPEEVPVLAEARRLAPKRLTPFALVNPHAPGVAGKVRELMEQHGFGGVLLFPAMHHFHLGGPEAKPLLEVLDELRGVAYVHCGLLVVKLRDLLGLPRPQDLSFANPLGIVPAANAHRRARFVVPHFGAGFFREALMAGVQCSNVLVDTSSSNSWTATQPAPLTLADVLRRALGVLGPERVVFGTDSGTFPAGWQAPRLEAVVEALEALHLPAADRELVLAGNARRLLARG
jgi:uncharacterized protein